jgi:serine/threonine protein kinase
MFSIKGFFQVVARPFAGRNSLRSNNRGIVGKTLMERYKVLAELGEGGLGKTYLAEDLHIPVVPLPRRVVKQILSQKMNSAVKRYFKKEAQALASLNHPQIPVLHASFEIDGIPYIVQDFIEGHDLSQEISISEDAAKCWTQQDVIVFLVDMLGILDYVHSQGIIHRDIKPSNIMRRQADDALILIDFGIVKDTNSKSSSMSRGVGTQGYMPLEQWLGNAQFNSDIYALGMTMLQAVTATYPAVLSIEQRLSLLRRTLSPALFAIFSSLIEEDYLQRCQSAKAALLLLEPLQNKSLRGYRSSSRFVPKSTSRTTNSPELIPKLHSEKLRIKLIVQKLLRSLTRWFSAATSKNNKILIRIAVKFMWSIGVVILIADLLVILALTVFPASTVPYDIWTLIPIANAVAYFNRGNLKIDKLNDTKGALADYNKAIEIKPQYAGAYINRGNLKTDKLNDTKGALADYNKAIEIDTQYAKAYYNRAILNEYHLKNKSGAIEDFRQAIKLFRQQGKTKELQNAINQLKSLGASE